MKRMEIRRLELILEIENRKRLWNAAMAGDGEAREFLSRQYRGMDDKTSVNDKAMAEIRSNS